MQYEQQGHALVFLRSWYSPDGRDFWLRVPIVRGGQRSDRTFQYVFPNIALDNAPAMTIDEETRILQRAIRARPGILVSSETIEAIKAEALDHQTMIDKGTPIDYGELFHGDKIRERYTAKFGSDMKAYFSSVPDNRLYNELYKTVKPRPCTTCGKRSKR